MKRLPETKQLDAVLDLVGNSTIMSSLDMLKRGGKACLAGWLGGLAPIPDFNPLLQMASGVYLTFFGSFVFGTPGFPLSDVPLGDIARQIEQAAFKRNLLACSISRTSAKRTASWKRTRPAVKWWSYIASRSREDESLLCISTWPHGVTTPRSGSACGSARHLSAQHAAATDACEVWFPSSRHRDDRPPVDGLLYPSIGLKCSRPGIGDEGSTHRQKPYE